MDVNKVNVDGKPKNREYGEENGDEELQDLLLEKMPSRFKVARVSISDLTPPSREREHSINRLTPTMEYSTYVYDTRNSKSFAQLTREALPRAENYRDIMQGKHACRPTLEELHEARFLEKVSVKDYLFVLRGRGYFVYFPI